VVFNYDKVIYDYSIKINKWDTNDMSGINKCSCASFLIVALFFLSTAVSAKSRDTNLPEPKANAEVKAANQKLEKAGVQYLKALRAKPKINQQERSALKQKTLVPARTELIKSIQKQKEELRQADLKNIDKAKRKQAKERRKKAYAKLGDSTKQGVKTPSAIATPELGKKNTEINSPSAPKENTIIDGSNIPKEVQF